MTRSNLLRPRRLFLAVLSLPVLFLLLLYLGSPTSRRTLSDLFATHGQPSKLPDEIFGLLHFVTSPDEADRLLGGADDRTHNDDDAIAHLGGAVAPDKPVAMAWYALGSTAKAGLDHLGTRAAARSARAAWDQRLKTLREEYPLVVFSKSYCPYSKRAKRLLETYDLSPPPKIIEVDLRADPLHLKTLLTRLTHRSTFPNVILHGHSLGGSDELVLLHEEGRLRQMLEAAGVKVGWTGEGGESVLV